MEVQTEQPLVAAQVDGVVEVRVGVLVERRIRVEQRPRTTAH
jgi:hypothetical protein